LQKIELLPTEHPERIAAWLNAAPALPALAKPAIDDTNAFIASVRIDMEHMVLYELTRFVRESGEPPREIRACAWTICEMHPSNWHTFPYQWQGHTAMIPVVADPRVSPSRVHCVGSDETVIAMRSVRA
jgi:hypothetical protein